MSAELKQLIRRRGALKTKIISFSKLVNKSDAFDKHTYEEIKFRRENIENILGEFEKIQTDIELLVEEDEEYENQLCQRQEFQDAYFSILSLSQCAINKWSESSTVPCIVNAPSEDISTSVMIEQTTSSENNLAPQIIDSPQTIVENIPNSTMSNISQKYPTQLLLPTAEIPKFGGKLDEWLEFKGKFVSIIHNNESLTNIQKFHYLKSALINSTSEIISTLDFRAENYEAAWQSVKKRFNKPNVLIHNHIKGIHDIPSVSYHSSTQIRNMVDKVSRHLHCLSTLGENVGNWDTLLIFILGCKLDASLMQNWESKKRNIKEYKISNFFEFLEDRAEFLESMEARDAGKKGSTIQKRSFMIKKHFQCYVCKGDHSIYKCNTFLSMLVEDRVEKVKTLKLCLNCFQSNHETLNCKRMPCRKCKEKHNILLHLSQSHANVYANCSNKNCHNDVLLATACVILVGSNNKTYFARALLDSGSQANFITEEVCNNLQIARSISTTVISGISNIKTNLNDTCSVKLQSKDSQYKKVLNCYIMNKITDNLPACSVNMSNIFIANDLILADDKFHLSNKIDLLLGAGVFWDILTDDNLQVADGLFARSTKLGWVISGALTFPTQIVRCNLSINDDVQQQLERFWQLEEIPRKNPIISEDEVCETLFKETLSVAEDGRFIVTLPFKENVENMSDCRGIAVKRFQAIERKFNSNQRFKERYTEFMNEYECLGHMSLNTSPAKFYLPHHGVLREDSLTTKLRVVFDGSAHESGKISLNEALLSGPNILDNLLSLLLRFRQHKIVVGADVEKMYRMIWVNPNQRSFQTILWRASPEQRLKEYTLNTVTYGTSCAPFLAMRCLKQIGFDAQDDNPRAAEAILRDFYVDDLITGANTLEEARELASSIFGLLKARGFILRKVTSNIRDICQEMEPDSNWHLGDKRNCKTLGLNWACQDDTINFKVLSFKRTGHTKRDILSGVSQIFDPLGLLAPCITKIKILLQKLWSCKLSWDDPVPKSIENTWVGFKNELQQLNSVQIPRWVFADNCRSMELHGFADASQVAYGACIYIRTISETGKISVNLLYAKSRVAPLKPITIPRLELSAAVILSEMLCFALDSLRIQPDIYLWSDSMAVLHWINTCPSRFRLLPVFIANRVCKILQLTSVGNWKHVRSNDNAADILSRGVTITALIESSWWKGPDWLSTPQNQWPSSTFEIVGDPPEIKKLISANVVQSDFTIFQRYSNFDKLVRITAYCIRFCKNCRSSTRLINILTFAELSYAELTLIKLAQIEMFPEEIERIKLGNYAKGQLIKLNPFIDCNDVLRVGGRLSMSNYSYNKRHPAVLHSKHVLTRLIFKSIHLRYFHLAPSALLAFVRDKYWPIGGRVLARKIVHDCITCFRIKPHQISPIMGNLPPQRIEISWPFSIVGTDYCGPVMMLNKKGRGSKLIKVYIVVFVCFATKAIHIELVCDLSTDAFIAALRRFAARRGWPRHIYSDNARNYVGANNEIAKLVRILTANQNYIQDELNNINCTWHFIPPQAPHFGGLWEAGVKKVKYHLKRVMKNVHFAYEDLLTLIIQIEGVVNSRPIQPLSSDPNDLTPLTPSHFLIGRKVTEVPDADYTNVPVNRLSLYQKIQKAMQQFWKRWKREYLGELQERQRWKASVGELKVDSIVIIKDDDLPPARWLLGKVIRTIPGRDGVSRVAVIKTASGEQKRAFTKLCPLPVEPTL